jgi:hypothetical protein
VVTTLVGIILADEALKVPPVDVGSCTADGSFRDMRGLILREAMDVNRGPLGPIVYNASLKGGRTVGTDGGVVPFVSRERRVCFGLVSEVGRVRRISCAIVKKLVTVVYGCVFTGNAARTFCVAINKSS